MSPLDKNIRHWYEFIRYISHWQIAHDVPLVEVLESPVAACYDDLQADLFDALYSNQVAFLGTLSLTVDGETGHWLVFEHPERKNIFIDIKKRDDHTGGEVVAMCNGVALEMYLHDAPDMMGAAITDREACNAAEMVH